MEKIPRYLPFVRGIHRGLTGHLYGAFTGLCFLYKWLLVRSERVSIKYRQTSNMSNTLASNKIVDHSDVVEASSVGAATTTSSFST